MKQLESDVKRATESEKLAVVEARNLRRRDDQSRRAATAAVKAEGALEHRVTRLDARSMRVEKELADARTGEAERDLRQKAVVASLSSQLAGANREVSAGEKEEACWEVP